LRAAGAVVGGFPEMSYANELRTLTAGSRLYLFSDGVYELARSDGSAVQLEEFVAELARPASGSKLDEVLNWASDVRGSSKFEDDISLLEIRVETLKRLKG
jgi:sigma-B regulation protein RsbU (phosphoserine phosphatase)